MTLSQASILVVDDTPANLRLLIDMLPQYGYNVRPAPNGRRAISAAQQEPPDLILLDIMMPEMDGYAVCQQLKADERTRDIPVIFLSSLGEVFDKVRAFEVGAVDYITKPFQFEEMVARMETHLSLQNLHKMLQDRNTQLHQEIAERKQTEQALLTSEAKLRALFASMKDVILVLDRTGRYLDIAPTSPELLYRPAAEMLGKTLAEIMSAKDAAYFLEAIQQSLDKQQTETIEYPLTINDRRYWFDGRISPMSADTVIFVARDITDRKALELGLVQTYEEVKHFNEQIQHELARADKIQRDLLPRPRPNWPELDVICYTVSAREVGGDWYHYHRFADNHFLLALGDVSGKGISAALFMAIALSHFETTLTRAALPAHRLQVLNKRIIPYTQATSHNCALCCLELTRHETHWQLRVANAGCIPPYIKRRNGTVEWLDIGGLPLGVDEAAYYHEMSLSLVSGDRVILVSDGVVEAQNDQGKMLGFERLTTILEASSTTQTQDLLDDILAQLQAFVGQAEPHDDITVVVAQA